jgi:hypothetical protein
MTALEDERAAHQVCVEMRDAAFREVERLRAAAKEVRAWLLKPENVDLSGSDRVYRLLDDALGTDYREALTGRDSNPTEGT